MTWYLRNPDLLATEQRCLAESYPSLLLDTSGEQAVVKGVMRVAGEVGYTVDLLVPGRYPREIPVQRCDRKEIPWELDRHVYPRSGIACLCVPSEYRWHWPCGSNLTDFLEDLVRPFSSVNSTIRLMVSGRLARRGLTDGRASSRRTGRS